MKKKLARWFRSQRSQGMTEFALIAPIILLLTFGIIDFGRGLYFYITLQQAANEGARVAVHASNYTDAFGVTCTNPGTAMQTGHCWPDDSDVAAAIQAHAVTEVLANPCPNGPIPNGGNPVGSAQLPPSNSGWIFITDPSPAGDGGGLNLPGQPAVVANGPKGGLGSFVTGPGCDYIKEATGNEPIKVTLWFNFQPLTPIIQQVVGNRIVITAYAVYRAEYSN
ncbi:MAG TPA: TadE family protein [Candidatus Acidoferrum sp.]|jgi:hypothetical protein|nr:TadE family protein [Candidatus Acidoferrum sp.]